MSFMYNWLPAIITVVGVLSLMYIGRFIVFRIPAIANTKVKDGEQNSWKWREKSHKYQDKVKSSQKIGLTFNLVFYVVALPFIVTTESQSPGQILLDCFVILMVYDFFYYMTHRFLFHGKGYFRRVHAVHHQARSRVSSIDSFLLHPWEIFIGIALFYVVTVAYALISGNQFHVITIVICNLVYTQINQINHCRIDLEGFPWKTLNWIAMKHDAHHIDMHKGNYATITLLFDWIFGTLERHPREDEGAMAQSQ
ncbi:MAG: sterol desaturase family protein [Pseudomonadales bacterium]|nr:sterol desaturase family protein [Pseudomonadales bacterium]